MKNHNEICQKAKALTIEERKSILLSIKETDLHHYLKELYKNIDEQYYVEVTHGSTELGKDLILIKDDKVTVIVIAVIVKVGNVRAKTMGEVDEITGKIRSIKKDTNIIKEIKSQIQMAKSHPAEAKAIFAKLPVTKIMVIIAGEVSVEARRRLESEIPSEVEVKDILWLIENFTDYYPQVFFDAELIDFIHNTIQKLESKHWLARKGYNLSDIFVDPVVEKKDTPATLNEENIVSFFRTRKLPFTELKKIINQNRKILLLGEPGVGKSGAISKICIDILKGISTEISKNKNSEILLEIPILVRAEYILNCEKIEDLLEILPDSLRKRSKIKILLIDALDEVGPENRNIVLNKLNQFTEELQCTLVVTTRVIDVSQNTSIAFEKYELMSFEYNQAIKLFEKLFKGNKLYSDLINALDEIRNQIPLVPLSLHLLMEIVQDATEIPASISELYDRYLDMIFGRWDKEKGLDVLFDYFIKKTYLSNLAHEKFYKQNKLIISTEDFLEFNNNYKEKYNWDQEYLESFIKEIKRIGILEIKEEIFFRHRSFLDYFNAAFVFDKRDEIDNINDYIANLYFNDIWSDSSFFYIGLKREITEILLNKILNKEGEELENYISKMELGKLLQAGWHSSSKIKKYGIENSILFASKIRGILTQFAIEKKLPYPKFFADTILMSISQTSFGSTFLEREVKEIINEKISSLNSENIHEIIPLFWSVNKFISSEEKRKIIDNLLTNLTSLKLFETDEMHILFVLSIIEKNDKETLKIINRKIKKLKQDQKPSFIERYIPKLKRKR
ncbi:AAA family ATPase [Leptospira biflexa]|uniref:NACHT domain-containing protein n=1 Tax=Leptospira biflexa TaxID=172 RepID=UPI001090B456|nr:AAA family ATPase [Leptospira biflexa]TGM41707.1 AAA family ATPase [Leptospira biflexa]TGM43880.1 AAA family ATPase [Leptospira biflexa]